MSWENYDDVISQLETAGLILRGGLEVGTRDPVRCHVEGDREKRGWYWLSEIDLPGKNGETGRYLVGSFGVWRGNDNGAQKIRLPKGDGRPALSAEERQAIRARQAEQARRAKAMRQAEAERAAAKAAAVWRQYVQDGESAYLKRKQVKPYGLRFSPSGNGTVAVPMADAAGRIWGLQIIRSERRKGQLEKEYWPKGLAKQGHYHLIGAIVPGGVVLVAEGYATAATLHEIAELPVAVAYDAGNLSPVAQAIAKAHRGVKLLICADDDYLQKCRHCGQPTPVAEADCQHCGQPHGRENPGVRAAKAAALAVDGAICVPEFPFDRAGQKLTDFNDLATAEEGIHRHLVGLQVTEAIDRAGWDVSVQSSRGAGASFGGSGGDDRHAVSVLSLDEAVDRFIPIDDGTGKTLFDTWAQRMAMREQMLSVLPAGVRWDDVKRHPGWIQRGAYFMEQVGFDPAGADEKVKLNLFTGWDLEPKAGNCDGLLDLLYYYCKDEPNAKNIYEWILKWLAYPLQNPGAKMRQALVVHGPQGSGKSLFFETMVKIYGQYGIVINQGTIEDKFNADWVSRKLFVVADEIVARQELYHLKNQLKGLITGDTVRVNPKNMAAHTEANHMNIVFLSNEAHPVQLEQDDRRHCVVRTPPKLEKSVYTAIAKEVENGGAAALYHYLLNLDLAGFDKWTEPPITEAKVDLVQLGLSSEERFLKEWQALELEFEGGVVPFCPCLGSSLYRFYQGWCHAHGEHRPRPMNQFIGFLGKQPGWQAGKSQRTFSDMREQTLSGGAHKMRKMLVPSLDAMVDAVRVAGSNAGPQHELLMRDSETKAAWLTRCHFAFEKAIGWSQ